MRSREITPLVIVNRYTGEEIADLIPVKRSRGGRFMKQFIRGLEEAKKYRLTGESYRVREDLICRAKLDNRVPGSRELALLNGMKQTNVTRAYKELMKAGFLVEKERIYFLNPLIYWNGSERSQEQAIRELFSVPKPTIAPPVLMVCEPGAKYQ